MIKIISCLLIIASFIGCRNSNLKENLTAQKSFTVKDKKVKVYLTAKGTDLRMALTTTTNFVKDKQPTEGKISVFVNPNKSFQTFLGIGGAFTDAAAEVFAKLSEQNKNKLIDSYYSKDLGIGYTLARIPIHSSDFSSESFTYVTNEDKELKSFSIAHDKTFRIPLIKRAIKESDSSITFFASPWSPPAFMKDNKNMLHGGKLLPEFYDSWALYFTKFISAYESEGIPIWGITVQNEPMATQTWESCIYTAEEERDFLKNHLGPTMHSKGYSDVNIIVWDHNRDLISRRASVIFDDPEAAKYAWGIGYHWYETWAGGEPMFDNLKNVQASYPDKKMLFTEGCAESFNPEHYQYWPNAERYGLNMINDFQAGTVGWTDWNILLDEQGGPNHVGNFCFAPVHADTKNDSLIFTPAFYYIGHFSKFIRPNAKRISTATSRSHLLATSFLNENGEMVTVVMNKTNQDIKYKLYIELNSIELKIPPHSIETIIY